MLAKTLRLRGNVTLEQLAEQTGISKGHLSRFERGEKSISIAALTRLARALDASVSALLGPQAGESLVHVARAGERTRRKVAKGAGDYEFVTLTHGDGARGPSAFIVHLNAMSTFGKDPFHPGEEMCFVLSGAVELAIASRSMLLRKGDFAQFPGSIRHRMRGLAPDTAALIVVTQGQN